MAKQKSLKKTIKSNKKKKLNLKNLDFKKNWKKLTYGGALSLLLFMSVGFAGYNYINNKNLEAQAAGWTALLGGGYGSGSFTVSACKQSVQSAYGPLWYVRTYIRNVNNYPAISVSGSIIRNGSVVGSASTYVPSNVSKFGFKLYASQLLDDRLNLSASSSTRNLIQMYQITNC